MATQTTGGGSTTSFTNTPQAKDDNYAFLEDSLRSNATLYSTATNTIFLDVMSNDLGGSAKSLFSVEDGDGNPITSDFDLLAKDVNSAGVSPWELTLNGNWVRINNGKIEYRIADGSGIPGQGVDVNSLNAGEVFSDQFVYAIRLGNGTLSEATVKINITGANDAAVISGDNDGAVTEDAATNTVSGTLIVTDPDAGQNELQPIAAGTAGDNGYGTFEVLANGNWTYTLNNADPDTDALAEGEVVYDTITVTSEDGTDTEVITVTITGSNDGPVANADTGTTSENAVVLVDVLANDTDVDHGAVLTVTLASAPAGQGSASIVSNQVQFDPGTDFDHLAVGASAVVTVSYTIVDEHGASSSSTIDITVTGTNDGPVANSDTDTTSENAVLTVNVLANDTDPDDGAVLTVTAASAPAGQGSASIVGNQVQFDPGSDFDYLAVGESVDVVVSYSIQDEHGASSSSTLTITVTGTNDAPDAVADVAGTDEDTSVLIDVLGNDSDPDASDTLSISAASVTTGLGSVTIESGQLRYDPGSDYNYLAVGESAVVTLSYTVDDGHGGTDSASVTVTVTGTNDVPALTAAQAVLSDGTEDTDYVVSVSDLLTGFSDPDSSDVLDIFGLTADHGTVLDNGDGTFTITPDANYNGVVTLSYNVIDGNGGSVPATLTFNLAPVNDPAVIGGDDADDVYEATASDPGVPIATGTLTAADVDNTPNAFQAAGGATTYGSYTIDANGQWQYILNNGNSAVNNLAAGAFLMDTFTVYSEDGTAHDVTITIHGADDVIVVTPPPTYNGTGDPNDFDSLLAGSAIAGGPVVNNGTNGGETIHGSNSAAADTLSGDNGSDSIYGHDGGDIINGQNGSDMSLYGQAGNDTITGGVGADQIFGGSGSDTIYGNEAPANNPGGDGGDTIYGGSGNDIIYGQNGNDTIIGGYGADTLTGAAGIDFFVYLSVLDTNDTITDFSGSDRIDLSAIDADSILGGDQTFGWGGMDPTANSLWFSYDAGTNTTTLFGDTDGNPGTAEFMLTLQNFNDWVPNPMNQPNADITF